MLSKTSVDEVFMHHFKKMSSDSVASPPDPHPEVALDPTGGHPSLETPHCPLLEKNLAGAHDPGVS